MRLFITAIVALFYLNVSLAQVSGNIQMRNKYGQILADNSGIAVVFLKSTGQRDTIYTDPSGNYNTTTLANGYYKIEYWTNGYWPRRYPASGNLIVNNTTHVIPALKMNEQLPKVHIHDTISGTLSPYVYYLVDSANLIVPVGDTLIIPEGCLLGLHKSIKVYGCLKVLGTAASPVYCMYPDSTFEGILPNLTNSHYNIVVDSTGTAEFNHCIISHSFRGNGNIIVSNSKTHTDSTNGAVTFRSLFNLTGGNLSLLGNDELHCELLAEDVSSINLGCNIWDVRHMKMYIDGLDKLTFENNYLRTWCLTGEHIDTIIFHGNYIMDESCITMDQNYINSQTVSRRYMRISQNHFYWLSSLTIGRYYDLDVYNNFGVSYDRPSSTNNILSFHHNVVFPTNPTSSSGNFGYPNPYGTTTSYPIRVTGSNSPQEYMDTFYNAYMASWSYVQPTMLDPSFSPYIKPTQFGANYMLNHGDPSIIDPDSTASDLGLPQVPPCLTKFFNFTPLSLTVTDSIYPGDTNNDGVCNLYDVYQLAFKYANSGPGRYDADINWRPQYGREWLGGNYYTNSRYSDTNGDGVVNYDDIAAIYQNFSFTHTILKQEQTGADLNLVADRLNYYAGDTVSLKIYLRDSLNPAQKVQGILFSLLFDSSFVTPGTSSINFDNNVLGEDTINLVTFSNEMPGHEIINIALARTYGRRDTFGLLATVEFVLQADSFLTPKALDSIVTPIRVLDGLMITQNDTLLLSSWGVNLTLLYERIDVGVLEPNANSLISTYPNPANNTVYIKAEIEEPIEITIFNINGTEMFHSTMTNEMQLDVSEWASGTYIVKLKTNNNSQYSRFVKSN